MENSEKAAKRPVQSRVQRLLRRATPLIIIACALSPYLYLQLPWEQAYRNNALPVLQAELDRLTPIDQGRELARNASIAPLGGPLINVQYSQPISCNDLQEHYLQEVGAEGWQSGGPVIVSPDLERGYHKVAGGYYVQLLIGCASNTSAVYDVDIKVPFPQNIAIIGSWLKG